MDLIVSDHFGASEDGSEEQSYYHEDYCQLHQRETPIAVLSHFSDLLLLKFSVDLIAN